MPIINLQKRSRELGRIRLGQKGDKGQPQKLSTFRFTSASQALLGKIAELYGGNVQPWTPGGGSPQHEVITNATRVPIMVPPQPVTQWHEAWRKSGCIHRCDGRTNALTDEPCDPEDPVHLEAMEKPTTRLNVVLRDVEGIGVWRVETHGWNAAIELPDVAEFLARAGGYVNGWLALEQRTSVDNSGSKPQTRHYLVPIIEVDVTPAQLMAGHGRVAAPALAGGPVGETPALAPAGPDYVALAADATTLEEIRAVWNQATEAGHMTQGLADHLQKRAVDIAPPADPVEQTPNEDGSYDADIVDDQPASPSQSAEDEAAAADLVWSQILKAGGEQNMTLEDCKNGYAEFSGGLLATDASAAELEGYLQQLRAGEQVAS